MRMLKQCCVRLNWRRVFWCDKHILGEHCLPVSRDKISARRDRKSHLFPSHKGAVLETIQTLNRPSPHGSIYPQPRPPRLEDTLFP